MIFTIPCIFIRNLAFIILTTIISVCCKTGLDFDEVSNLFFQPERIEPPDPSKPDYDIRADVWSLGITLVELATGQLPYHDCKTDFEVLTRVLNDDPPRLPEISKFSREFRYFVQDW